MPTLQAPPVDLEQQFASHVGAGIRTRTTVRETVAEYARYERLCQSRQLPLKLGSLLAVFAQMAHNEQVPVTDELAQEVREAYSATYCTEPPYNWTGEIADPRDVTSTPAGP